MTQRKKLQLFFGLSSGLLGLIGPFARHGITATFELYKQRQSSS